MTATLDANIQANSLAINDLNTQNTLNTQFQVAALSTIQSVDKKVDQKIQSVDQKIQSFAQSVAQSVDQSVESKFDLLLNDMINRLRNVGIN